MGNETLIILMEHFKNILKTSLIINVIGVSNAWQNPSQKDFQNIPICWVKLALLVLIRSRGTERFSLSHKQ